MFSNSSYDDATSSIVKRHAIPSKPVMQICRCAERSACIVQRDCAVTIIRRGQACALDAERVTSREMNQACRIFIGSDCCITTLRPVRAAGGAEPRVRRDADGVDDVSDRCRAVASDPEPE